GETSQKVSGFLARSGEKCKAPLAWRASMSPGDLSPEIWGSAFEFWPYPCSIPPPSAY
ncbi:hypothetical protein A2U01_0054908, partial [Trifolium medium]|nr:hypothetical protein [Trifolium medium]